MLFWRPSTNCPWKRASIHQPNVPKILQQTQNPKCFVNDMLSSRQWSCRSFQQDYRQTSQEIHLKKSTWLGREIRWMSLGLPHNGENPNESYAYVLSVWVQSCTSVGDSDSNSTSCPGHKDDEWGEASTVPPRIRNFRQQTPTSSKTNRALPSSNHQSLQQESQGTDFQERRHCLTCQMTHGDNT